MTKNQQNQCNQRNLRSLPSSRPVKTAGFTLIELLVSLLIISTLMIFSIKEYLRHIETARIGRARADIEELIKSVRLYNIRENRNFGIGTFSPQLLGTFVGNYLEKEPPRDPWGNYYRHDADTGVVFSTGPDGISQSTIVATWTDDIVMSYMPATLFMTRAEHVDTNFNDLLDFGDYIDVRLSRPMQLRNPVVVDFETVGPAKALGSAKIKAGDSPFNLKIEFAPPDGPTLVPGETRLFPREYIESIVDLSPKPQPLQRQEGVVIEKKKR
jgi:general secretion pathway protein G